MKRTVSLAAVAAVLAQLLPAAALAQTPPPTPQPPPGQPPTGAPRPTPPPGPPQNPNKPKPYADVVTKEAKTDDGLFKTHQIDDRYLFEIPKEMLGREILWVTSLVRSKAFYGFGMTEIQDRVIRFEKRGDKVLLRAVSYDFRADDKRGDAERALEKGRIEPILATYEIKAYGPNESAVIEGNPVIFGEMSGLRFDQSRSFIDTIRSFPQNIEVQITGTTSGGPAGPSPLPIPMAAPSGSANTVVIHHSAVLLPEKPMMPRLYDSRVGWFSTSHNELGSPENRVKEITYIDRWRLEKKDPNARLSEPVKPITYYLGAEIPTKWKPYVKKGVEMWNAAFEKAGFQNAVVCREFPTKEEDPEFDPEDVRYTVVRWLPSGVENAYGPHLVDPRSGEILNGSPKIFHNILKLTQSWFFVQASPNDKRAQKLPLPEDITGDLLAYVVTHEVGHTLGFPHNMKASSSFSIKQLRDAKWTKQWGVEASIMDYGRFNYVAQPGDGAYLMGKLGPYDHFAVEWGYTPIPGAKTPEDEKSYLNLLATRQKDNPMLRFGNANPSEDPARQTEDLGDDGVEATRLGMLNLKRVMGYLLPATTVPGDDYTLLDETYSDLIGQRVQELIHVVNIVGGVNENDFHAGQGKAVNYTPVPKSRQKKAVQFLAEQVLTPQTWLIRPDVLNKLQGAGGPERLLAEQNVVLNNLLFEGRLRRMAEQEANLGGNAYGIGELLDDLRKGVFTELGQPAPQVGLYRRNLQKRYLDLLASKLSPPAPGPNLSPQLQALLGGGAPAISGETKANVRGTLEDVRASLRFAQPKATDRATRLHVAECLRTIEMALDPRK